jgi:hypothetical protein
LGLTQNHPLAREQSSDFKVKPYDIPLRSLIAADVDGLTMAGRCISGDFFAHASYPVTGNAVPMGEAAGKVAAVAAKKGCLPHQVEGAKVSDCITARRQNARRKVDAVGHRSSSLQSRTTHRQASR